MHSRHSAEILVSSIADVIRLVWIFTVSDVLAETELIPFISDKGQNDKDSERESMKSDKTSGRVYFVFILSIMF